jgi:hypothetical protein
MRNSGQIKVAALRAAHLNLTPRCCALTDESSLSSRIESLVPQLQEFRSEEDFVGFTGV